MAAIVCKPGIAEKLDILARDGQYDLACACGSKDDPGRTRGGDGRWIYPVTLPNGGKTLLFKTLVSNICDNDCKYCPLRAGENVRRCSLGPDETAAVFLDYLRQRKVFGLFLSSAVTGSAEATMDRLITTAKILRRKHRFRGFLHLKIIPGASNAAIEEAVSLASTVSLNIETPGALKMTKLSAKKDYIRDIIEPIKLISHLTAKGNRYERVKQTTQFIVGAASETDAEIVKYTAGLYDRIDMHRVYYSAYQKGLGEDSLPAEQIEASPDDIFMREHRLYQVDFLFRKYGFKESEIVFDNAGKLSLDIDPKEAWANMHPEKFPVDVNKARRNELLRVPGLGPLTGKRIMKRRKEAQLKEIADIGKVGTRLEKANKYLTFNATVLFA